MGRAKQLLHYNGGTLIEHAIQQAENAAFHPIVVVLGANSEAVAEAVSRTTAQWVLNENWQTGMGSSISAGIIKLLEIVPATEAVAILLADQPHIKDVHLSNMAKLFELGKLPVIAARYANTKGVPAIFNRSIFSELKMLPPATGARSLLRDAHPYDLPEAATDIDTPDDFAMLS